NPRFRAFLGASVRAIVPSGLTRRAAEPGAGFRWPSRTRGEEIEEAPMSRNKAEDFTATDRPFTGKEYLESLRDGREIYIYGERVADVTTHPPFPTPPPTIPTLSH